MKKYLDEHGNTISINNPEMLKQLPGLVEIVDEGNGPIKPFHKNIEETAEEKVMKDLEVMKITPMEVDDWVDNNILDFEDVKSVLKDLIKKNCKRTRIIRPNNDK